jgi:hypothetical protein
MRTVYLMFEGQWADSPDVMPKLVCFTEEDAKRFCRDNPTMTYVEFTMPPADADREAIHDNLRELFALSQRTRGIRTLGEIETAALDGIIKQRCSMHCEFLRGWHQQMEPTPPGHSPEQIPQELLVLK